MAPPWKLAPPSIFSDPEVLGYQNTKNKLKYQKVIDKNDIVGYAVYTGPRGGAVVRPIYRGTLYVAPTSGTDRGVQYIFDIMRTGDTLHGWYADDPEGATLANIALTALLRLEGRHRESQDKKVVKKPPKKKTKK